ncbi:MAG TPA: hypothetical protein VK035_09805 [Kiloniellales bacterium]|nr:hypothetical protein [Kiloniellales bacterium]
MLRQLLTVVLPLAAPFLAWWLYLLFARHRTRRAAEADPPGWTQAPWLAIVLASLLLLVVSLFWFHGSRGGEAWRDYSAPSLEDGQIVPSRIGEPTRE